MTLVATFDSLHNDFKMITALLLYFGDKDFKEIQQIVTSTEVANLAKQRVGATTDLTMIAKKKQSERSNLRVNKEYFNYEKKGY